MIHNPAKAFHLNFDGVRRISKNKILTKTQCAILLRVLDLWNRHESGSGVIYPGCGATSLEVGCSRRTVIRAFERFRELGLITPYGFEKGGWAATRYKVNLSAIHNLANLEASENGQLKLPEPQLSGQSKQNQEK